MYSFSNFGWLPGAGLGLIAVLIEEVIQTTRSLQPFMEEDKRASSPSAPVKLFVGCVPSEISLATLEEHLRKFGEVTQVTRLGSGKSRLKKGNGHCVVVTPSSAAALKLIEQNPYNIAGRSLKLEMFQQGKDRNAVVAEKNQRRFFLKGLDPATTIEDIIEQFKRDHGEIENVHFIQPKSLLAKSKDGSSSSGSSNSITENKKYTKIVSIQFKILADAIKFSEKADVLLGSATVGVEPYNYLAGRTNRAGRQVYRSVSQPIPLATSPSLGKREVAIRIPTPLFGKRAREDPRKIRSFSFLEYHDLKPTTKRYHSSMELGLSSNELHVLESSLNFRFNISSKQQPHDQPPQ